MNILQIAALGIISAFAVLVVREHRPEIALVLGIGSGVMILILVLDGLFEVVYSFYNLAESTGLDSGVFSSVLKIVGVGYITEFAAGICVDSNNKSLGDKVMLGGKVMIMVLALPIIKALFTVITEIMP